MQIAELNMLFANSAAAGPWKGQVCVQWVLLKGHKRWITSSVVCTIYPFGKGALSSSSQTSPSPPWVQREVGALHWWLSPQGNPPRGVFCQYRLWGEWYSTAGSYLAHKYITGVANLSSLILFWFYLDASFVYFIQNVHSTYIDWGSERQTHSYTLIWKDRGFTLTVVYLILYS